MKNCFFLLFLLLGISSCDTSKNSNTSLTAFIPPESAFILKTEALSTLHENLLENSFFKSHENIFHTLTDDKLAALSALQIEQESLLCFSRIGRDIVYALITPFSSEIKQKLPADTKIEYGGEEIYKYPIGKHFFYSTTLKGNFIGSNSKLVLEKIIRRTNNNLHKETGLQKVYNTTFSEQSIFINNTYFADFANHFFPKLNTNFAKKLTGWTALDIVLSKDKISLNGVVEEPNNTQNPLLYFENQTPQETEITKITPFNALGVYAFTYSDYTRFHKKLNPSFKTPVPFKGLFTSVKEVGVISFKNGKVLVLNSKNEGQTEKSLLSQNKKVDTFRKIPIYAFTKKDLFYKNFHPLINLKNLTFYTRIGHFFLFSSDQKWLENCIAHFQNKSTLASRSVFESTAENLSDESTFLFIGINQNIMPFLAEKATKNIQQQLHKFTFKKTPFTALQITQSDGFSHLNLVFQKANTQDKTVQVAQIMALKLDHPMIGNPQFFEYWRTGEQYVVAQDEKNMLYLFNNQEKLLWKKQLKGPILGQIQTVDLFKNKRLQMAFVTPEKFYVIDRNGKDVAPFPIDFSGTITLPLAVFDYANNRNYRFMITRDNRVNMLNNNGKEVAGFAFPKSQSRIVQAPKHIRFGTKDYILIPEASGRLNILNRQGKPRIKLEKKVDFSNNPWFGYEGKFTSTNRDGQLIQIDEQGKISIEKIDLAAHHAMAIDNKNKVSISDNILNINGNEIEMNYGLYGRPQFFTIAQKIFISITDRQANKVYLFNTKGELLPGFPVYGNSAIDLSNIDNKGRLEFIVKGEDDTILIYQIQ